MCYVSFCGIPEPSVNQTENLLSFQRETRWEPERGVGSIWGMWQDFCNMRTHFHLSQATGSQTGTKKKENIITGLHNPRENLQATVKGRGLGTASLWPFNLSNYCHPGEVTVSIILQSHLQYLQVSIRFPLPVGQQSSVRPTENQKSYCRQ